MATADQVLQKGANSFGFIRLTLASCVIVSHAWPIGGFGIEPLQAWSGGTTLGLSAVTGFFALSGLLVGLSAERSNGASFFRNRCARILPGYWVCLLVSAFVLGALICIVRDISLGRGLLSPANSSARTYVVNNFPLSSTQYSLGRSLEGMPYPSAINGSLWSLPYEFACYLFIFPVVKWFVWSGRRALVIGLVLTMSIALAILSNKPGPIFTGVGIPLLGLLDARLFFNLWSVFLAGAALALYRTRVRITAPFVVLSVFLVILSLHLHLFWPIGLLALPYLLLGIAHFLPRRLRPVGTRSDISYGMYLYGFPVSQLIVAILGRENLSSGIMLAILSILATIPIAACSWHFVERPFAHVVRAS